MSRHRTPEVTRHVGAARALLAAAAAALVCGGVGAAVVVTDTPAPVPAAAVAPADPLRVRYATVDDVPQPGLAVLDGRETVRIAGIKAPAGADCGADEALTHARSLLQGERVTVVPDPAEPGGPVHLVLASQQSYSDAALVDGYATVSDGPWTYRAGGIGEALDAAREQRGLWADGQCWEGHR